jgi:hypothetical protein
MRNERALAHRPFLGGRVRKQRRFAPRSYEPNTSRYRRRLVSVRLTDNDLDRRWCRRGRRALRLLQRGWLRLGLLLVRCFH